MNKDDIIRMALEAGASTGSPAPNAPEIIFTQCLDVERFAALVAAHEREKVAQWIIDKGYATGHGDTIIDLLIELDWQVREACAKVAEGPAGIDDEEAYWGREIAKAIRARGKS